MSEETRQTDLTFHMAPREYYDAQPATEDYQPEPMRAGRETFIHCTDGTGNLADTGTRFYAADPREFIALVIDKSRVTAPIKYEDPNHIFPHIYGPLNRDAIARIIKLPRDKTGKFLTPELAHFLKII